AGGFTELGTAGVAGVAGVLVGGGVRAILTTVLCEGPAPGPHAAYAAAAAPKARRRVVPRTRAASPRPCGPLARLRGAAAPHCRHQSWSSFRGAPQFAQVRWAASRGSLSASAASPGLGGFSGGAAAGESSAVAIGRDFSPGDKAQMRA